MLGSFRYAPLQLEFDPAHERSIAGWWTLRSGTGAAYEKEPAVEKGITYVGLDAPQESIKMAMPFEEDLP
jgi:hypothetical protein